MCLNVASGYPFPNVSPPTCLNDSRCGYLTRKGVGPDCFEVGRATVPRPPPSITMAMMEKTSSVQVNLILFCICRVSIFISYLRIRGGEMFVVQVRTGRCSPSPPSTSVSTRASVTVGHPSIPSSRSCVASVTASVCFASGSVHKKKEKNRKKGLSYEELRLPAITAFTSGRTQNQTAHQEKSAFY